jgi:hypothetical protein
MDIFHLSNNKFVKDARKALFIELSTRLEMMAEDLDMETSDDHFVEMVEIIKELRVQAQTHRNQSFMEKTLRNEEVQF